MQNLMKELLSTGHSDPATILVSNNLALTITALQTEFRSRGLQFNLNGGVDRVGAGTSRGAGT